MFNISLQSGSFVSNPLSLHLIAIGLGLISNVICTQR